MTHVSAAFSVVCDNGVPTYQYIIALAGSDARGAKRLRRQAVLSLWGYAARPGPLVLHTASSASVRLVKARSRPSRSRTKSHPSPSLRTRQAPSLESSRAMSAYSCPASVRPRSPPSGCGRTHHPDIALAIVDHRRNSAWANVEYDGNAMIVADLRVRLCIWSVRFLTTPGYLWDQCIGPSLPTPQLSAVCLGDRGSHNDACCVQSHHP
jgi:hypothetical protein